MALGTAFYGFLAIWISFRLARKYLPEQWAFLGSSRYLVREFPARVHVFQPIMVPCSFRIHRCSLRLVLGSHASNAHIRCNGRFLGDRRAYDGCLLSERDFALVSAARIAWTTIGKASQHAQPNTFGRLFLNNVIFAAVALVAFLPTFVTKKIIYGSSLNFGYGEQWFWNSPALLKVCFSSEHGLFSWTPIVFLAVARIILLRRHDRVLGLYSICCFAAYLYVIGCYQDWDGLSSFGNRFFVSLTVLFVLGLSAVFRSGRARSGMHSEPGFLFRSQPPL